MSEKKHKRGDVREDGMVFWGFVKSCVNGERWITPAKFSEMTKTRKERFIKKKEAFGKHIKTLKIGDVREDGMVFWKYNADSKNFEWWVTESDFITKRQGVNSHRRTKRKDPLYNMKDQARHRIFIAFRTAGYSKNTKTEKMIGCSFLHLKQHIESQFTGGMKWDNMGEWHIDHRIPLGAAASKEELTALCHYTNLQPLWAVENIRKADKYDPEELKAYLAA